MPDERNLPPAVQRRAKQVRTDISAGRIRPHRCRGSHGLVYWKCNLGFRFRLFSKEPSGPFVAVTHEVYNRLRAARP